MAIQRIASRWNYTIRQPKFIVLLLTLIAFGLRVYGLSFQPLWGDEGWSVYFAVMPLAEMVALTAVDIHPPLYYALLHGWFALAAPGAETARFLSVAFGTLLVPVMYAVGSKIICHSSFGRWGGVVVAAVTTVAPMAVYYSQEVRMYGLVTLLGLVSTYFFMQALKGGRGVTRAYVMATTLALYTMYYAVFIVIFQGIYLLLKYRLRRDLLKALLLSAALYLPWMAYAGVKLANYVQQKIVADQDAPLKLVQFLASYLSAFSLGHPSEALQAYLPLSLVFVLVALVGAWSLWQKEGDPKSLLPPCPPAFWPGLYLLVPLILGWLVNLVNPFNPPYFERTLLVAAPAWWLLVGAGLVWLWQKRSALATIVAGLLLAINLVGLFDFYTVPRYPDEDYRPLLAEIAARATPEHVLLASYQWQLGYYHAYLSPPRPRLYPVPDWGVSWGTDPAAMRRDLSALLQENIVWFPAHQALGHGWEDQAEGTMAEIGYPTLLAWYNPNTKLSLVAPQTETQPGPTINFDHRLQAQVKLPLMTQFESGRGIIPLEITWTTLADPGQDYLITLKLVDAGGEVWAKRDTLPQANRASFVDLAPGRAIIDRHGLLVSGGIPPGTYSLKLGLTSQANQRPLDLLDEAGQPQGVEATLMAVDIQPARSPVGAAALAVQFPLEVVFDRRLKLVGYGVGQWTVKTGKTLPVNLFWQGLTPNLPDLTTFVQLQDDRGQAVALTERPPAYPTSAWQTGDLLRDLHRVRVPAPLTPGTYKLAAGVLLPDKTRLTTSSGDQVVLGTVTVESRPHHFQPPTPNYPLEVNFGTGATLIGYDLEPPSLKPGEDLTLSLYWQGQVGFEREWAIFAHLIDAEGRIWGQRDQFPGQGAYPTTGWIKGEYITDIRQIPLKPDISPGAYFVEVGLYDPNTFERVPIQGGGDAVILETPIVVKRET